MTEKSEKFFWYHFIAIIDPVNFVEIGDGQVVRLVDLTWNDPRADLQITYLSTQTGDEG